MSHILTIHGRQHFFASAGPRAHEARNVPALPEMCHSLANINRYTGHTRVPYSVAEHSLLVARIYRSMLGHSNLIELLCLIHDGHECVCGDVASPIKAELGQAWHQFEEREQYRFLASYGLLEAWHTHKGIVKRCDLIALATERRDLLPFEPLHHLPWPVIDTPGAEVPPAPEISLHCIEHNQPGYIDAMNLKSSALYRAIINTARAAGHSLGGRLLADGSLTGPGAVGLAAPFDAGRA